LIQQERDFLNETQGSCIGLIIKTETLYKACPKRGAQKNQNLKGSKESEHPKIIRARFLRRYVFVVALSVTRGEGRSRFERQLAAE
jgi:hypothetical protein